MKVCTFSSINIDQPDIYIIKIYVFRAAFICSLFAGKFSGEDKMPQGKQGGQNGSGEDVLP